MRELTGFLRGINLGGWLSQCRLEKEHMDSFIQKQDIEKIRDFGLDHVRLPIDYALVETEDGEPLPEGYIYIDNCMDWCEACGLHVVLDLHRTYGYRFEEASQCRAFFETPALQERFYALWEKLAARYGSRSHVAFDILNEVVDASVTDSWNRIAASAVSHIRKFAPDTWILIGGANYNHICSLPTLLPPPDAKTAYSFHFYEPMLITHQGAYWSKGMPSDFRASFPRPAKEYVAISEKQLNGKFGGFCKLAAPDAQNEDLFLPAFQAAAALAEERKVPLYCGEYGVINNAEVSTALAWHKALHNVFEQFHIGRAVWSYKEMDFGIIDPHYKEVLSQLLPLL